MTKPLAALLALSWLVAVSPVAASAQASPSPQPSVLIDDAVALLMHMCESNFEQASYVDAAIMCANAAQRAKGRASTDATPDDRHTDLLAYAKAATLAARSASHAPASAFQVNQVVSAIMAEVRLTLDLTVPPKDTDTQIKWLDDYKHVLGARACDSMGFDYDDCYQRKRQEAFEVWKAATPDQRRVFFTFAADVYDADGVPCHVQRYLAENYDKTTWWYCDGDGHYNRSFTFLNGKLDSEFEP